MNREQALHGLFTMRITWIIIQYTRCANVHFAERHSRKALAQILELMSNSSIILRVRSRKECKTGH